MYKTEAIVTKVENFKENHLSVSVYSTEHGQKSLVVFGGKSKKKALIMLRGDLIILNLIAIMFVFPPHLLILLNGFYFQNMS